MLELAIHAYLLRTREPWGILTIPGAMVLMLLGVAVSLYLLVNPSTRWSAWLRTAGVGAALFLLFGAAAAFFSTALELPAGMTHLEARAACQAHMSDIARSLLLYAAESGRFPVAESWQHRAVPGLRQVSVSVFRCPSAAVASGGYAYNERMSVVMYETVGFATNTVLLFESDTGPSAAGGRELLPDVPRHNGGDNYALASGRVYWLPRRKLPDGSWAKEPEPDWVRWRP
jgi:hypothetical protein